MPQVVVGAAVSGLVAGATAGATVAFSTAFFTAFAGSLVLGGISYALTPKPKRQGITQQKVPGSTISVRQPDLSRFHVYGHTRATRGYAHIESTDRNGNLHQIIILCNGPVRAINEVWVNDYAIPNDWINSSGVVTEGRYANNLTIRKHLGTETQGADSLAVTNMPEWTTDHRLAGVAYLYVIMKKNQDVYPTGAPNFSAIIEGKSVYDPRIDADTWTTNVALYCRDYLNAEYGYAVDADDFDDVNISAQANICDEIVDTNAENYEVSSVAASTDIITLDGDILKLFYGDRVQISSTGSVPGGLSAATDYYVVPYQVKDTPRIMLATSLANALDKTTINITSAGSGTITITKTGEPRYHGSGIIDTEVPLNENMNNFATCMAGRAVNIGGKWTFLAGAWRTPDVEFELGDIRGAFAIQSDLPMSESYNAVKGLFISQVSFYQQSDYPAAQYQQFIDDDGGVVAEKELNLAFTDRPTTAQRIAKIELFRGRQPIAFKSDFTTKAILVQPGDNVDVTIDRMGWEEKAFEVTDFSFKIEGGVLMASMALRETAQEIFDWTAGEAIDFDPAPNTNLPNPFDVTVPIGVSYSSDFVETRDGDLVYNLVLAWTEHEDAFVREYGDFEIQFKLSTETEWLPSFFVDGSLTETGVVSSSVNTLYDLRIRARNNLGARSNWVTITNAIIGNSGGVGTTIDWGSVADAPSATEDWGSVADTPTTTQDWGFVV